jgi:hypothetical protein
MTVKEALEKATQTGYNRYQLVGRVDAINTYGQEVGRSWEEEKSDAQVFLDPLFWQSLGKAMKWCIHSERYPDGECKQCQAATGDSQWLFVWHCFIDGLAEGKSAEQFFGTLPLG